ncbi:MAG: NAD-dependent DNA ligase LigA [Fibrobacterota bacterium]
MDRVRARIETLRTEIRGHDHRYYVDNAPVISDYDYDTLLRELKELLTRHPEFESDDCPTRRVGSDLVKNFRKVTHTAPMLSIDNSYNEADMRDFHGRIIKELETDAVDYTVEAKIDGAACSLMYEGGRLTLGKTRGDGMTGDDVTQNIRTIRVIPLSVPRKEPFEVRGEVYMTWDTLRKLNAEAESEGEKTLANPRNAAAGALKLQDPRECAEKSLRFFAYYAEGKGFEERHTANLNALKELGFAVNPFVRRGTGIDAVLDAIRELEALRADFPFDIDGAVIKVDRIDWQKRLGNTAKSPRWVMAFKYPPEKKETRILAIVNQVGRTGVITPVAEVEPVHLSGTTVSRATLHNFEEIARLDARVGDTVLIEKSGEIIPKILSVVTVKRTNGSPAFLPPAECPECSGPLVKDEEKVALRCDNPRCPGKLVRGMIHFVSRKAMNVDSLGPAIVEQLFEKGLVRNVADLYALKKEDIAALEKMGGKSAQNIVDALEKSKANPLSRLLFGLGIPHVGEKAAKTLARRLTSIDDLIGKIVIPSEIGLSDTEKEVPASLAAWFSDSHNLTLIDRLKKAGLNMKGDRTETKAGFFTGKSVVITGTLKNFDRTRATEIIETMGGKVTGAVTKKTDYLLCGENAGSKLEKAKELGVKIVGEETLDL